VCAQLIGHCSNCELSGSFVFTMFVGATCTGRCEADHATLIAAQCGAAARRMRYSDVPKRA
jgi:hypothetical protein